MVVSLGTGPGLAMPAMPAGDGSGCRSTLQRNNLCCDWLSVGEQVVWCVHLPGEQRGKACCH